MCTQYFFKAKWLMIFIGLFVVTPVEARENVTDWYIQDFRAEFDVHADSTMTVTEWITADCGNLPDKHGIFRVLPTVARTPEGNISTPVDLVSITDFSGKVYKYTTSKNNSDTVTWKIGDPDKTVTGVNQYKIVYTVRNVIRDQGSFDEWYWNVVGNFWTIPIDTYEATITFPKPVEQPEKLTVYSGGVGIKDNVLAEIHWKDSRTLVVQAKRGLLPGEGITLSQVFLKGQFIPYQFSWWELYGKYLWFLVPAAASVYLYRTWRKYGDDSDWNKPIIPEYEMPEGFTMLTLGSLMKNGGVTTEHVTAALIELAVKGVITLRKETEKILFFNREEFILEKHLPVNFVATPEQTRLLEKIFETGDVVRLSDLKRKFYPVLGELGKLSKNALIEKGLMVKQGFMYHNAFIGIGIVSLMAVTPFISTGLLPIVALIALDLTAIFFLVFGFFMPKRTQAGVETYAKIKGLKLYMETAEKYRQQFYEKEGIFEVLLPAAILFGMTKEWIKKMEEIYGADYFTTYHPAWFVGSFDGGFNTESFTSAMESVSSSIASNMGTSSGASGGGSSGGGGGGGGGGGW